jgi:hypothetical protein
MPRGNEVHENKQKQNIKGRNEHDEQETIILSPTARQVGKDQERESGRRPGLKTNPTFIERGIAVPSIHV